MHGERIFLEANKVSGMRRLAGTTSRYRRADAASLTCVSSACADPHYSCGGRLPFLPLLAPEGPLGPLCPGPRPCGGPGGCDNRCN